MQKDWSKRFSDCQLQETWRKTLIGSELLQWRQSVSLHTWRRQGPCKPSSCTTFRLNSHWGRAATGKKKSCICACTVTSVVSDSLWPCRLWPARLLCQGGKLSRQEYWSILANNGCHTLLEYYISCCPSRQLPWISDAARTRATQAAAPPPHLALTGVSPSPPGQPQEQTLWMTHWRGGNKTTVETQGRCG